MGPILVEVLIEVAEGQRGGALVGIAGDREVIPLIGRLKVPVHNAVVPDVVIVSIFPGPLEGFLGMSGTGDEGEGCGSEEIFHGTISFEMKMIYVSLCASRTIFAICPFSVRKDSFSRVIANS